MNEKCKIVQGQLQVIIITSHRSLINDHWFTSIEREVKDVTAID